MRRLLRWAFPVVALAALTVAVWTQRDQVRAALADVTPGALAASLALALLGSVASMLAWRALLADLGSPLAPVVAGRVFFLAQLGKYIPGSVWTLLAQVELSRDLRVPPPRSGAAAVLSVAVTVLSGVLVAAATAPALVPDLVERFWWVLLAVPLLLALLHPSVIAWWTSLLLRLARRPTADVGRPGYRGLLVALVWMLVAWALFGLHCWVLVEDAGSDTAAGLTGVAEVTGVFALAWLAGAVAFVPAGAGVREGVLVLGLSPVLTTGGAIVVALLSRLVLTAADLVLAGAAVALERSRRPRAPFPR